MLKMTGQKAPDAILESASCILNPTRVAVTSQPLPFAQLEHEAVQVASFLCNCLLTSKQRQFHALQRLFSGVLVQPKGILQMTFALFASSDEAKRLQDDCQFDRFLEACRELTWAIPV